MATASQEPLHGRESLMLQLQPWTGEKLEKEGLRPPAVPQEALAYGYLGDMQLRLLFEQPGKTRPAAVRAQDLQRFELTPGKAMTVGAGNTLRTNGAPQINPLAGGVYVLRGARPEYNASYLLDRAFWRGQLQKFPQGLLAAVPRRGVLMFVPADDPGEGELTRQAAAMLASAGADALSSLVYRFDAEGWHPHAELPKPAVKKAAPVADDDDESRPVELPERDDSMDLDKAAAGQRMLVFSLIGGFIISAMGRAGFHPALLLALYLVLGIYSLLGVVRLTSGLGKSTGATIFCMVLTFVPLVSLLCWIVLSVQATRTLRAAGWQVGLLGAKA